MLSKYFYESELECKGYQRGNGCCNGLPADGMNVELMQKLDALREAVQRPVYVTSGYRCPIHNSKVSYATLSFHTKGMAVDIYCDGMTVDELADKAVDIGFRGVERNYDMDYVHVDVRTEQYYFVHFNGADYECDGRGNII